MHHTEQMNETKPRSKGVLLLLAVMFILPFTAAVILHLLDIRPGGKSFGTLVSPIVALQIPAFDDANGQVFSPEQWSKIWNIVMINEASCDVPCEKNVDKLDRVQRSLRTDKDRVQRILILQNTVDATRIQQLKEKFPSLIVLPATNTAQQELVSKFTQVAPIGSVYLVDPLNNLMMYYPNNVEPKALRADIKKLLKNSWGG